MSNMGAEIALILVLILLGGAFTAAETSLISLRESQVRQLATTRGKRGRRLERLVSDPNRFLAAVQIGVTFATMLSSAFGAATLAGRAGDWLATLGLAKGLADTVALIVITLILAFISLVLGELTPKRLGLQRSEAIALLASGPLSVVATLFRPLVWLLGRCTNGVVRVLGGDPHAKGEVMSEEELQGLVQAHESLTTVERRVISDVFAAEDTMIREVMVARPDVEFLPASMTLSRAARHTFGMPHSRFPVTGRDVDEVVGVVHIKDILAPSHPLGRAATVGDVAGPVSVLPGTKGVLDALHEMRAAGQPLAVVVDEYGGTDGIVTIEDLVEEIVGEMHSSAGEAPGADQAADRVAGEVDGRVNLDDFAEQTGIELEPGPYDTAGGYLMAHLGRVPVEGDRTPVVDEDGTVTAHLAVVAMDGRRVARIAVLPVTHAAATGPGAPDPAASDPAAPDSCASPAAGSPGAGSAAVAPGVRGADTTAADRDRLASGGG